VRDDLAELAARLTADVRAGRLTVAAAERQLGRRAFTVLGDSEAASPAAAPEPGDARLAAVLRRLADLEDDDGWRPAPEYGSVALAVIDAVWSIGVRYTGVVNVIGRYTAARVEQGADARMDGPEDLLAFIADCGSPDAFANAVKNRQRTSTRSGILKAEAVGKAADALARRGLRTPTQLRDLDRQDLAALEADWRGIEGQGSGLSFEYFLMLCGMSGVKADRHIRRFVAEAVGATEGEVSADAARALVIAASDELGLEWRVADYAIWNEMASRRGRGATP